MKTENFELKKVTIPELDRMIRKRLRQVKEYENKSSLYLALSYLHENECQEPAFYPGLAYSYLAMTYSVILPNEEFTEHIIL